MIAPVVASRAQYSPLFCPAPTTSWRWPFAFLIVNRLGPDPKSKSGPGWAGQLFGEPTPGMQATFQSSKPCTPVAHLIAPEVASSATTASTWSLGSRHVDGGLLFASQVLTLSGTV